MEPHQRRRLVLDSGVTWEQLSSGHGSAVDFPLVRYEVGGSSVPGDAISFDSVTPHRLTSNGDVPVEAIWFVHGRDG